MLFTLDKLDVMSLREGTCVIKAHTHGNFTGLGLPSSSFITT